MMVKDTRSVVTKTKTFNDNTVMTSEQLVTKTETSYKLNRQRRLHFKARNTKFDITDPDAHKEQFRGFYTLFWVAMTFYGLQTFMNCYHQEGILLTSNFFRLFSKDALTLLISDLVMVSITLFSVPFSKLLVKGVLHYETTGVILQHFCQALFLFGSVYWVFWRDWPWVQSGFFTMHSIVMMMKMHSYTALNGDLSIKLRRLTYLKQYIPKWLSTHQDLSEENKTKLEEMEEEINFLEEELIQGQVHYPNNVTLKNYIDYLLVPSLVYWMEYPRTNRIRPWYIFEKTMATFASFLLLYITTERYILPKLYDPTLSELHVIFELLFPFMINYLFIFYIIFECILNAFAEISRFADRNFYDDWWNSVSYDEFARKWNKPVHHWLLRHIYARSIESYKITKTNATFLTFLFSSCLHEMVLVICTRKIRMYLFVLQMFQLPLIMLGRKPFIRERYWLGNTVFWLSMMVGPPLLGILYCREVFWSQWVTDHLSSSF
ncbi:membrane bound O-acyl transferase [Halteromyces radiatus]|uniref:membrane bound O-acyl transferase n=1 Tax=Halteromyces radiatus TaxID=101107 RepID=UPI00221E5B43|nr:membrane bound O-acyl transferase [Halteromyces radiatus]KAI8089810.1 membrane bound O-acyl transferase [Halteromyces radiatus]